MAVQLDSSVKDDLKTQFITREGTYRLMTLSEYSRPNRVGYTNSQSSPQVRVSIVTLPSPGQQQQQQGQTTCGVVGSIGNSNETHQQQQQQQQQHGSSGIIGLSTGSIESRLGMPCEQNGLSGAPMFGGDRICFNFGKELYVYAFRGVKKGSELSKPIDKKLYKGTNPSCHDFNATSATPDGAPLLVGFTTGQIQLVYPGRREPGKLYNEDRLIDKTKVTCLKWLPGSMNLFLASHSSGHLYLYNETLPCTQTVPNYQPFKMGDGYTILTCKSKSTRNPLYKWVFSTENCCINEFCFSPCGSNLAIVSQDGFLRVFHYDTMELLGIARSYFGGFLCVCWSPDGKYIVVGGEDDLVTVWSLHERRVVARGQGHRSWVSVVAFDPYTTSYSSWDGTDFSDDENPMSGDYRCFNSDSHHYHHDGFIDCGGSGDKMMSRQRPNSVSFPQQQDKQLSICYRLGSVSQDTQLCLWDITEDVLRHPLNLRQRVNSITNETITSSTTLTGGGDGGGGGGGGSSSIHLNGEIINNDNVKVIKPIATTNSNNSSKDDSCNSNNSKNSSNSSTSKFSTANCTMVSNDNSSGSGTGTGSSLSSDSVTTLNNKNSNGNNKTKQQLNCMNNIVSSSKRDSIDGGSGGKSTKSELSGGLSALNSLTQRLSNFSFGSDKNKSTTSASASEHYHHHHHHNLNHHGSNNSNRHNHRKTFSLSKSSGSSYNYHQQNHHSATLNSNNGCNEGGSSGGGGGGFGTINSLTSSSSILSSSKIVSKLSSTQQSNSSASVISSYDPMKLIGTPACPRFDECPLLEPLICKKIAHERLTALIFREDCFLTACQDGFIYTWARPGYSNVPQHMSPSPSAPPGGTVV